MAAKATLKPEEKRKLKNRESEEGQKFWRWIVAGLLVLLAAESWIGSRRSDVAVETLEPASS